MDVFLLHQFQDHDEGWCGTLVFSSIEKVKENLHRWNKDHSSHEDPADIVEATTQIDAFTGRHPVHLHGYRFTVDRHAVDYPNEGYDGE